MKKYFTLLVLFLGVMAFSQISFSQAEKSNRWTYGGNVGLGFGSNGYFNLQLTPRVGYRVADDLEMGLLGSLSLQTSKFYKSTVVGVGPFANYYIGRSLFISGNFQQHFINYTDKYSNQKLNRDESVLLLGGGYMQKVSEGSYFQVGLMYNVLWKENSSIYSSGLVPSVGFVVGL